MIFTMIIQKWMKVIIYKYMKCCFQVEEHRMCEKDIKKIDIMKLLKKVDKKDILCLPIPNKKKGNSWGRPIYQQMERMIANN